MVSSSNTSVTLSGDGQDRRESHLSTDSVGSEIMKITDQYTFPEKMTTGIRWMIDPFRRFCGRYKSSSKMYLSKAPMHLKPQLNRVNGLLKYFTFGVMFTNGM